MKANKDKIQNSVQDGFAVTCASIISGVISFFILLLVTVFPLIYHDDYYDILETKYHCYWLCVIGMLSVCLILALIMMIVDFMEHKGAHVKMLFSRLHPMKWKETFCLADGAVIVFLVILVISTLQSDYLYEAFWGNEGRYTGMFLLTLYVTSYFVISRFWKVKGWVLEAFLCTSVVISIIGITDYFQLDVLGFRRIGGLHISQSALFTSTLGNINTFTAYVALLMALSAALFATAKTRVKSIWYYVCMVVSFFAIIMGCSDNAYLAIGALFAILPLVLFKTRKGIKRYMVMAATFFTVVQMIDWINQAVPDMVIGLDSLFRIIVNFSGLLFVVVGLWLAVAGIFLYDKKTGMEDVKASPLFVKLWLVLLAAVLIVTGYAVADANFMGNAERYGAIGSYLVFNDQWGTMRGYIWRKGFELYLQFTPMHKVFGYGPDTFGILAVNEFYGEMISVTSQKFDNVHNEYLQYLITIGPIGLTAYIVFLVSAVIKMLRNASENPYIIGCCFAVICYGVQALVNLNLPIATPVMWLLLSVGVAACRQNIKEE